LAGNHATFLMSLLGAEVLKIEQPHVGDALRNIGPFVEGEHGHRAASELGVMRNKRSITIDIKQDAGLELLWRLIERVDVFFSNQKPSSLRKLGITFESLTARNPRIIYTTLSGFGHDDVEAAGPCGDWPAFDIIAQGMAGLQFRAQGDGDRPGANGLPIGDEATSILSVLGTVAALFQRERDGQPQRVDAAMHDALIFINQLALTRLSVLDKVASRGRSGTSQPYGAFPTSDGWVNLGVGGDVIFRRFADAVGQPELAHDDRFRTSADRVRNMDELDQIVEAWTTTHTIDEVIEILHAKLVPCAPVYTLPEVLASPQVEARKMLVTVEDPIAGPQRLIGNPLKMSSLDPNSAAGPPPMVGGDTVAILTEFLDMNGDEIESLLAHDVITTSEQPTQTVQTSEAP
jgi:crotonobetainyl-CoA:carnitine CoA-transferase CaiB-like acyl-CoA transferase